MSVNDGLRKIWEASAIDLVEKLDQAQRSMDRDAAKAATEALAKHLSSLQAEPDPHKKFIGELVADFRKVGREAGTGLLDRYERGMKHGSEPLLECGDDWDYSVPERDWLIRNWLPAGRFGMLCGMGKIGKSKIVVQLCAGLAGGFPDWLGERGPKLEIDEGVCVVLASWEDEADEVARRLRPMCVMFDSLDGNGNKVSLSDLGGRFRYVAPSGLMWGPRSSGSGHVSTGGEMLGAGLHLQRYCEDRQARLLVVDTRSAAFGSSEIDRGIVREFLYALDTWAQRVNCAVLLVTHSSKAGEFYTGSTDWLNGVRFAWHLGVEDTEGKTGKNAKNPAMRLDCIGSNYGYVEEPMWLIERPDGYAWEAVSAEEAANWRRAKKGGYLNDEDD